MGFLICGLVFVLPLALLIGSVILRAAVSLANSVVGDAPAGREVYGGDWGDDDDEYVPVRPRRRGRRAARAIPEPTLGQGMMIVFAAGLVNLVVGFGIGAAIGAWGAAANLDPDTVQIIAQVVGLPVGFLIMAVMLNAMLPTTFPRACLVTVFQYLIVLVIGAVILGAVFALGAIAGR